MLTQIYRYQVLRLLGKSANNEVFEAHDPVLDRTVKIYRWTPPADSLNSSLAGLDGCLSGVQELGVEVFSEAGSLCIVATNDDATRTALKKLRANRLFPGYWGDIIPKPSPRPTSTPPPPLPPIQPAKKSGWFWKVSVTGITLAGVFVAVGRHDNPVPSESPSYEPEKPRPNPAPVPPPPERTPISRDPSERLLSKDALEGLTKWDLLILRNLPYARHGYTFRQRKMKDYFSRQPWYRPSIPAEQFLPSMLTPVEQQNIALISQFQKERGLE